ncbi:hypothetical protein DRO35_02190 [Candidatus Bathyarchaeota archaeon]|nr:MAG: hypothetical protein DRO35_02190 [Candidatus Bathyarchaeota archaeon]
MEIIVLVTLAVSTFATSLACFARDTRQAIHFLFIQAAVIGFVELMYCLINLLVGLHIEALINFFATFAEWFSCAVVVPLIIYWGMIKTENMIDKPVISIQRIIILVVAIAVLHMILWIFLLFSLPAKLDVLPFGLLMFSLSVFLMTTRRDPLKILVGLNMAENALYPLLAESPVSLVPVMLALMIFVNIVGVFVITEAYREYGTLSITEWRWTS